MSFLNSSTRLPTLRLIERMKLLLINPNTSEFVTERAVTAARAVITKGTVVDGVTGTFGAPIINSEADLAIGAYSALELAAKHAHGYDAIGLAVSFDCGLEAVREILDVPVVGLAEASVRQALNHGGRFAVISFAKRTQPLYLKLMRKYTDPANIAMVECLPALPTRVLQDPNELRVRVEEIVAEVTRDSGCDSVVLLATAFAGLTADLSSDIPVIDCVTAMIGTLEECVSIPKVGEEYSSAVFPEQKTIQGVSAQLARHYENFPPN